MTQIGNVPQDRVVIRAAARKSFTFGLWVTDTNNVALDISTTQIRIVAKQLPLDPADTDDSDNLFDNNVAALGTGALLGYATFNLQATDLDHKPGEYPFVIVLHDEGYSSILVRGVFDIVPNTEFVSLDEQYTTEDSPTQLQVKLRGKNVVKVQTGPTLAPGTQSFRDSDAEKLGSIDIGAQRNVQSDWNALSGDAFIQNRPLDQLVPHPQTPGEVLSTTGSQPGKFAWAQPTFTYEGEGLVEDPDDPGFFLPTKQGGLIAHGVAAGLTPVTLGTDMWAWQAIVFPVTSVNNQTGAVILTADDIAEGLSHLFLTQGERDRLASIDPGAPIPWSSISDKPAFGTAALKDEEDFLASDEVVPNVNLPKMLEMPGVGSGTTEPTGGEDGDAYFQREP